MRRIPLLVLLPLVLASLSGVPLPARTASAAPRPPTCEQKLNMCQTEAYLNNVGCKFERRPNCAAIYQQALQTCDRNYQICKLL
jgi:hypothetical protein